MNRTKTYPCYTRDFRLSIEAKPKSPSFTMHEIQAEEKYVTACWIIMRATVCDWNDIHSGGMLYAHHSTFRCRSAQVMDINPRTLSSFHGHTDF